MTVRKHGFPFACMLCGSDENPQVSRWVLRQFPLLVKILIVPLILLGPVGWIFAALLSKYHREAELPAPTCECCSTGMRRLVTRDSWVAGGGLLSLACAFYFWSGPFSLVLVWLTLALWCWAALEFLWLHRQFQLKAVELDGDRIVVDVPYDDYPGLYQRHLDTALLYGSSNQLGIEEELVDG